MSTLNFVRTPGLPETLAASTMYLVRDAVSGKLSFVVTDANGVEAHSLNTTDVQAMIEAHAPEALGAARNISMTGDGTWTVSFDGSADASAAFTLVNSGIVQAMIIEALSVGLMITAYYMLSRASAAASGVEISS